MSGDADTPTQVGIGGSIGWSLSGAIGGAIGALAFGLLMWLADPAVIETTLPAAYGLEAGGVTGWAIQLVHGAFLGLIFGFLVTRKPVLGVIRADVATDALARTNEGARVVAAGFVYGLAIWAVLPLLVVPAATGVLGTDPGAFPAVAPESLLGHVLFGTILGGVFAALVDLQAREETDVFDEDQPAERA